MQVRARRGERQEHVGDDVLDVRGVEDVLAVEDANAVEDVKAVRASAAARAWAPRDDSLLWSESHEYRRLYSPTGDDQEFSWGATAIVALLLAGLATVLAVVIQVVVVGTPTAARSVSTTLRAVQALLLGGAVIAAVGVLQRWIAARNAFYARVRWLKANEVDKALAELKDGLTLRRLFALNRKQLDEYHVLSVRNASVAFRNATVTSLVAFAVLIAGAVLALRQPTDTEQWVAGGLTGLGTVLTTFISANFFRSWERTTHELKQYYAEPTRTGKLLSLERLARTVNDEEGPLNQKFAASIVERLLAEFAAESAAERTSPAPARRGGRAAHAGPVAHKAQENHAAPAPAPASSS